MISTVKIHFLLQEDSTLPFVSRIGIFNDNSSLSKKNSTSIFIRLRFKKKNYYHPAFPRIKGFATNISHIESYFSISRMLHGYPVNARGVSMKVSFARIMHYVIYVAYRLTRISKY